MITIKNTTIYKCEHCRKTYQKKHFCEAHELKCAKNPKNFIKCSDCNYLKSEKLEYYEDHGMTESYIKINAFFCTKKEHWLYPYHKCSDPISSDNIIDEIPNNPMPSECDLYKLDDKYI